MKFLPLRLLALCQLIFAATPKRGLVYISSKSSNDDKKWTAQSTDLTWYYNYWYSPTSSLAGSGLQYVPMLWGPPDKQQAGEFYNVVKSLKDRGQNITHVLGFNEPDGPKDTGGSAIKASDAGTIWMKEMDPIRNLGLKIGAPAVTGNGNGISWLQDFVKSCDKCQFDFIPIHYYGPFEGLPGFAGQMTSTFGNKTIWVTEFAFPQGSAAQSQDFLNRSLAFLDSPEASFIERYSYFGTYRNDVKNWVGSGAAMMDSSGRLTAIGRSYSGSNDTGASDGSRPAPLKLFMLASILLVFSILM